jgi:molybdopterin adenylyltransferase
MHTGILTISTSLANGKRPADISGDVIAAIITDKPFNGVIAHRAIVADNYQSISDILREWVDSYDLDLILTTGGTGLAPSDVTPEATLSVIDRHAPGIAEALRAGTSLHTPLAWLSRGVSGIRNNTLIINLPGGPKAVHEYMDILRSFLPHAIDILTEHVHQHNQLNIR